MPIKLLRPVQYESVLGSLNKARPLSLADEGRVILSIPVLNAEPASNEKTARGKFLRCSQGSPLVFNPNIYSGYHLDSYSIGNSTGLSCNPVYDPPAEEILLNITVWVGGPTCHWRDPDYNITLFSYTGLGSHYIPYRGSAFHLKLQTGPAGLIDVDIYAFYGKDI